jgi:hypothetical protein
MHGMLSLWVLVAAFAVLAGWAAYLSVRLYRACPAVRARPRADFAAAPDAGEIAKDMAEEQTTTPGPVP